MSKSPKLKPTGADIDDLPELVERNHPIQILVRISLIFLGGYVFYHSRVPSLLFVDPSALHRPAYLIGYSCSLIFAFVAVLLTIWRHIIQRGRSFRYWRLRSRKPVVVLTFSGLISYFAFMVAFWPVYGFRAIPLFTLFSYSILSALSFV